MGCMYGGTKEYDWVKDVWGEVTKGWKRRVLRDDNVCVGVRVCVEEI